MCGCFSATRVAAARQARQLPSIRQIVPIAAARERLPSMPIGPTTMRG